ncbi:MAG TPA: transporter substrate-binding domain-containing protein [Usitatibacter sp.]
MSGMGVALTRLLLVPMALALAACVDAPAVRVADVAPSGTLRVAIGVGPAASAFWATRDAASGQLGGVTVELGKAGAAKLGVPMRLVEYRNSGEITAAASKDAWDISFMPQDAEREKFVDVGPAYVVYESAYLVRAGSDIRSASEVDRAGIRVGGVEGTSTSRTVAKALKNASLTLYANPDAAVEVLGRGGLDALAMGRDALAEFSRKMPGTRLLDEVIQSTGVVVVVPKSRPAAREWAARFLEEAKADGTVRRALDGAGFAGAKVAPPAR